MMTIVKWNPQRSVFDDIDSWFDMVAPNFKNETNDNWEPSFDISDNDTAYKITVDLPGVDKKDISVTFEKNILKIEGEKKQIPKEKEKNYYQSERTFGHFSRSFRLPATVEAENISASYRKGVLSLTVPKAEVSKPKQIDINVE